ncbi:basic proline-rich protein-like [Diceros bicornis minor]|uniref:basic proline-rich protein-like n=1 Tax=Diceros bicornis minor TaxID=77932 RepID=UPI0026F2A5B5|nr:basic proline-rich protein-like [Diceros bicornis minor]
MHLKLAAYSCCPPKRRGGNRESSCPRTRSEHCKHWRPVHQRQVSGIPPAPQGGSRLASQQPFWRAHPADYSEQRSPGAFSRSNPKGPPHYGTETRRYVHKHTEKAFGRPRPHFSDRALCPKPPHGGRGAGRGALEDSGGRASRAPGPLSPVPRPPVPRPPLDHLPRPRAGPPTPRLAHARPSGPTARSLLTQTHHGNVPPSSAAAQQPPEGTEEMTYIPGERSQSAFSGGARRPARPPAAPGEPAPPETLRPRRAAPGRRRPAVGSQRPSDGPPKTPSPRRPPSRRRRSGPRPRPAPEPARPAGRARGVGEPRPAEPGARPAAGRGLRAAGRSRGRGALVPRRGSEAQPRLPQLSVPAGPPARLPQRRSPARLLSAPRRPPEERSRSACAPPLELRPRPKAPPQRPRPRPEVTGRRTWSPSGPAPDSTKRRAEGSASRGREKAEGTPWILGRQGGCLLPQQDQRGALRPGLPADGDGGARGPCSRAPTAPGTPPPTPPPPRRPSGYRGGSPRPGAPVLSRPALGRRPGRGRRKPSPLRVAGGAGGGRPSRGTENRVGRGRLLCSLYLVASPASVRPGACRWGLDPGGEAQDPPDTGPQAPAPGPVTLG